MINYLNFITDSLAYFASSNLFQYIIMPMLALCVLIMGIAIIKAFFKGEM